MISYLRRLLTDFSMDVHSTQTRSYNMSHIRDRNTKPEIIVRKLLWSKAHRYRLHRRDLPGKPDIVFPGKRKVIFINGCFWHEHHCEYFKWPDNNAAFWKKKITDNVNRDKKNYKEIMDSGWAYLVIWECETKAKDLNKLWIKIESFLKG